MKTSEGEPSPPSDSFATVAMIEMVGDPEDAFTQRVQPLDVSALDSVGIVALAACSVDDLVESLLAGNEELHARLDPPALLVAAHAETEFEAVASIDPEFWDGVLQVASYQLQQNLGRVFDVETAEPVLRYGYVLRALDDGLGLALSVDPDARSRP